MSSNKIISPFGQAMPNIPIKEGAPPIARPTKDEISTFPAEAQLLLKQTQETQSNLLETNVYNFDDLADKHFLLAGATGPGIGGALAIALLDMLSEKGGLTVIGRDLSKSVNFETGKAMQAEAEIRGFGNRFHWLNAGMALEGRNFNKIIGALKEAGADKVIYMNAVAAANSGLLPGMPPVFVKDVGEDGLFQWQLTPLDDRSIAATKFVMGEMAVQFVDALEQAGITVELAIFADWRGSRDKMGRDPQYVEYGRQGAYSTSLYLPKEIIQNEVSRNYGSSRKMIDIFYPIMRTRALPFIPGGTTMAKVYDFLMNKAEIRRIEQPELALNTLQVIAQTLAEENYNPFPRLDAHEAPLDDWFYEVVQRLNNDENSDFYFKRWM